MSAANNAADGWIKSLQTGPHSAEKIASSRPFIFNHIMTSYAKKNDYKAVEEVFQKMEAAGLKGDAHTYSIVMGAAADANDKATVLALTSKFVKAGIVLSHSSWRVAMAPFGRTLDHIGTGSCNSKF